MTEPRAELGTIAIVLYLIATPAAAAEFTHRSQPNGPDVISIRGEIYADDDKKFIEIASDIMHASIILDVKGGHIGAAISIGRFTRFRNYETRVQNGAVCNSACTLIWLAGTLRHLDRRARLGFHSAATTPTPPYRRSEPGNARMATYMTGMGVPQQVIDLQPKADPCCLNYVDYAQAKAWRLLSDRSSNQQALPAPKAQEPGSQHAAALAKAVQQPGTTTPASPKIEMLVVRPLTASPLPRHALPTPSTQQLAAEPRKTEERVQPGTQQDPVSQKVVLYEEDPANPNGKRFVGSAIWRTETITPDPGQPPELAIRADIEVQERQLALTWTLRRNTDKGIPATHVIEILFKLPADFP
jgi:hypothetical protein